MSESSVVYRVITDGRGGNVAKVLLKIDGPSIQAWHPEDKEWFDAPWLLDYVHGDDINETVEVDAEAVEAIKEFATLAVSRAA